MGVRSRFLLTLAALLLALAAPPSALAGAVINANALRLPGVSLRQVQGTIDPAGDGGLSVNLTAARADVPAMGWRRVGLRIQGRAHRDPQQRWVFDGRAQLADAPGGALSDAQVALQIDVAANTLTLNLSQGESSASTFVPLDQPTHAQIVLKKLPATWLRGLLGTVWSGYPTGGQISASMAIDQSSAGLQAAGEMSLDGVGFDTPSSTLAGNRVDMSARLGIDTAATPTRMSVDGSFKGGELLLGPIYARLPAHAVQLSLEATAAKGAFAVSKLRVNDPDALQLQGSLAFDARGTLQKLSVDTLKADFPAAYGRYGQAWLAVLGVPKATLNGKVNASVDMRADGLHAFTFDTGGLDMADTAGHFAVRGLRGSLDWSVQGNQSATTLAWRQLDLYRLPFGAASSRWRSRGGELALQPPLNMSLLGGKMHVSQLGWRPAATKGERFNASLALAGVDMSAFSTAMGWPKFPGTLGGAVSGLRMIGDRVELEGGLSMNVFGGFVDLTGLSLQQPFGPAPVLAADISLSQLNLAAITSVFDFGGMTGLLGGSISKLRLVNWTPVAFDAHLLADKGGRISQRAVNNLTSVGGGGLAGGLQGAVLKLFDTFGYRRIGLNCRLQGSVCHMSGLEPRDDGYAIVEGSGLPYLRVIGHQSQVDWPVLLQRLKAAINGAPPQVR